MVQNRFHNLKGSAILCVAALVWGLAFVAQNQASDLVPPFLFNSLRSLIASLFLFILLLLRKLKTGQPILRAEPAGIKKTWLGGLICGFALTFAVNFQQAGIGVYPEGTAVEARGAFLTVMYVIFVPLLSVLFLRKRLQLPVIGAILLSVVGIYFLSAAGEVGGFYLGDLFMLACALTTSVHIICVDRFGGGIGGIQLSMLQFLFCGIFSAVLSLCTEEIVFSAILHAAPQILYLGIMSSGVGYTLQIFGQKYAEPAIAAITMSLESVFAALGGWLISGNTLTVYELIGCALVFAAILLCQTPLFFDKSKKAVADAAIGVNSGEAETDELPDDQKPDDRKN